MTRIYAKLRDLQEATGMPYDALGAKFGVCMTLAWKICNGKNWQHV
jgi:hypothetical protein